MTPQRWQQIHALHDQGLSIRATARRLGLHRRTVREALQAQRPPKAKRNPRGSIIDPYRGWLLAKLEQYPELSAVRLLHMLKEQGYGGGYGLVKQCVAELRQRLKPAYFTLRFAPGECAQVDWGTWKALDVPGGRRRISFFVMVLCHSRMMYAEFSFGQAMEHWLSAHRNAFEYFGGVPQKVMVDNCKTAVLTPAAPGQEPLYHPDYLDFAGHYGFRPIACTVRRPNEKGRVEQAVGYIKSSFLAGREPSPPQVLAPALAAWLQTVANVRVHGTTNRRPAELFAESEKGALSALPAGPHPCAVVQSVAANNRFRIVVDTNRYSVPSRYASQRLRLTRRADRIVVHAPNGNLIADHPRNYGRGQNIVEPDHERELLLHRRHANDRRMLERFLALGTAADSYLTGLREKRPDWRGHVRRINALAEANGRDRVARALLDGLEHNAFSSQYVLNIIEARQRLRPHTGSLNVTRRKDLLELDGPTPNLDIYDRSSRQKEPEK